MVIPQPSPSEVATVTSEPPPLSAARCVCKSFCRPSAEASDGQIHRGIQGEKNHGKNMGKPWEKP